MGWVFKNSYYTDLTDRIDLIAVESSLRAEKLGDLGYTTVDSGFIKLDHFPQLTHDEKRACQQEMRIEPGKPTILYAPTFYPSSLKKTIPIIPDLVSEMNVIIKLHQFNWIMPKYLPLKEKLLSMEKKLERLTLVGFDKVNILDFSPLPIYWYPIFHLPFLNSCPGISPLSILPITHPA
ncbi:MAG: hypothetical protein Ct9H300mP9_1400 [Candidatus Neomarinimicrobiota bacterium]|nr:MAG: hypothetical protein Ct9H300mP9_1400 [Candidatus Neomarinimicrobiota bacterium]